MFQAGGNLQLCVCEVKAENRVGKMVGTGDLPHGASLRRRVAGSGVQRGWRGWVGWSVGSSSRELCCRGDRKREGGGKRSYRVARVREKKY